MTYQAISVLLSLLGGYVIAQDSATTCVSAYVRGNISVIALSSERYSIYIKENQQNEIVGHVSYLVIANQPKVCIQVKATDLYHSTLSDPNTFIPLSEKGVSITDSTHSDLNQKLTWTDASILNGLPAQVTQTGVFTSQHSDSFHEEIDVHVTWEHLNRNLPLGTYQGHIKLIGFILP